MIEHYPSFFDEKLRELGEVPRLGFSAKEPYYMPKEYLLRGEFVIMRLAQGLGDWGIVSAMPRLLKEKFPECKVYVPSPEFLLRLYSRGGLENWNHWPAPEQNAKRIFLNNPYIDGFIDEHSHPPLFHDHFRIYEEDKPEIPLVEQMLRFWGFDPKKIRNSQPEIYWTDDEKTRGDFLIQKHFGGNKFAGFINTNSDIKSALYGGTKDRLLKQHLERYKDMKFIYYGSNLEGSGFEHLVEVGLNLDDVDVSLREQLYIRSKAEVNIGYMSSMFDIIARYTKVLCIPYRGTHDNGLVDENYVRGITYLR